MSYANAKPYSGSHLLQKYTIVSTGSDTVDKGISMISMGFQVQSGGMGAQFFTLSLSSFCNLTYYHFKA